MGTTHRNARPVLRRALLLGAALVSLAGCASYETSMLPGSAASLAQDRIMMVRKSPPTFGYERLVAHCATYPDLNIFVSRQGVPDFLAETRSHGRHYLILYYLTVREAYACRDAPGRGGNVEFSGPYPVTAREYKVLDDFRKRQEP